MKFDGNLAWQQAMIAVKANRDVLFALAGVFFLLPALVSGFFLSDVQAALLADPEAMQNGLGAEGGKIILIGFGAGLVQAIGTMAMLSLLTDAARPTVGQAIGAGLRALPTVIAAALLTMVGLILATVPLSLVASLLAIGTESGGLTLLIGMVMLVGMVYVMVKLSLLLPVVVIDRAFNPITALVRSWRLTKGNSVRLFFFYLLLFVAYMVIAIVFGLLFSLIVGGGVAAAQGGAQAGAGAMLAMSLVSGIISAAASVVMTAVLAAIHRQLGGPSPDRFGATFE